MEYSNSRTILTEVIIQAWFGTTKFTETCIFPSVIKAECIYHDQIDDQMLRRPDGRPDAPAT